jgi:hypothetical protein
MAREIPRLYECNILELLARQRQPTCLASLILKHYTCLDRVGYVKDKVSATKVTGVEDLKTQIRDGITTIEVCWITHGKNWNFEWMFSVRHVVATSKCSV